VSRLIKALKLTGGGLLCEPSLLFDSAIGIRNTTPYAPRRTGSQPQKDTISDVTAAAAGSLILTEHMNLQITLMKC
jgi:hypothetical protein